MKEVVSANVWNNKLRKIDKINLLKFLPDFPTNDTNEKKETLKKLFLGRPINFQNQVQKFVQSVKDGEFNASVKPDKVLDLMLVDRNTKVVMLKRRLRDLQRIVQAKKKHGIHQTDEEHDCLEEFSHLLQSDDADPLSATVDNRFQKIMERISAADPDTARHDQLIRLYHQYLREHPPDFRDMRLIDVINRCQNDSSTTIMTTDDSLLQCGPMTRKRRLLQNGLEPSLFNKYAKLAFDRVGVSTSGVSDSSGDSRSESSDDAGGSVDFQQQQQENSGDESSNGGGGGADTDSMCSCNNSSKRHYRAQTHHRMKSMTTSGNEFRYPAPNDDFMDLFGLLQCLFLGVHQHRLTTTQVEARIQHWQASRRNNSSSNASTSDPSFNRWASLADDWVPLTASALTFLNMTSPVVVDHRKKSQIWHWKRERETHDLHRMFLDWWNSPPVDKTQMSSTGSGTANGAGNSSQNEKIPMPLYPTDWQVRPSTADERIRFQMQERKRFMRPWRGFVYCIHGYSCVVAPVRGCQPGRDYSNVKARGHPLLINDRPPHVNIVEIVRDAVARLPNGQGSRADIVTLAMDSAFWNSHGNEKTIGQCISSALDRLQGESNDPSVRYNSKLKLWFYRHRHRSLQDLEEMHLRNLQDEIKKYRGSGSVTNNNSNTNNGLLMRPTTSQSVVPQTASAYYSPLISSAPPLPPGPRQSYQQFSQAINNARELIHQPISTMSGRPSFHNSHHPQPVNNTIFVYNSSRNNTVRENNSVSSTTADIYNGNSHYYL